MSTIPFLRRRSLENSFWFQGQLVSALATPADTGGALAVFDVSLRPGAELPPHRHGRDAEALFVLEGRIDGWAGDRRIAASPGTLAVLPPREAHGWQATRGGENPFARFLWIAAPGDVAGYIDRFAEPAPGLFPPEAPQPRRITCLQNPTPWVALGPTFGIHWLSSRFKAPTALTMPAPWPDRTFLGDWFRPLAQSEETGGAFIVQEWLSPADSRLPFHRHEESDEILYVLEGEVDVIADGEFQATALPGDLVFLPRHLPHAHLATGGRPARALLIQTPGDPVFKMK